MQYYMTPEDPPDICVPLEGSEHTPFINDLKNTLLSKMDTSVTKKLGGGSPLQTKVAGEEVAEELGLLIYWTSGNEEEKPLIKGNQMR